MNHIAGPPSGPLYVRHVVSSKTKQDRPTVIMEYSIEVDGTSDSVATFRSYPMQTLLVRYSGLRCRKTCSNINTTSCLTSASDHSCRKQSATVLNCC